MHRTFEGTTPAERGSGAPQAGRLIDHSAESNLSRTCERDEELSRKVTANTQRPSVFSV